MIDLLGSVFTGDCYHHIKRFMPAEKLPDPGTLWHEILSRAIHFAGPEILVRVD